MIKNTDKKKKPKNKQLGEVRIYLAYHSRSQSIIEGNQGRNLKHVPESRQVLSIETMQNYL